MCDLLLPPGIKGLRKTYFFAQLQNHLGVPIGATTLIK